MTNYLNFMSQPFPGILFLETSISSGLEKHLSTSFHSFALFNCLGF